MNSECEFHKFHIKKSKFNERIIAAGTLKGFCIVHNYRPYLLFSGRTEIIFVRFSESKQQEFKCNKIANGYVFAAFCFPILLMVVSMVLYN